MKGAGSWPWSARVQEALDEADALPSIAVLYDPPDELLEAYSLEERVGVVAIVSASAEARAAALEAGALEALDPTLPEPELLARLSTAVARFRSRLHLEESRDLLDRETGSLERNLRLAARLQQSLLPAALPAGGGVRMSSAYLPRDFVSGDTYGAQELDERHLAVYTLDAMGHGVRAALLMVLLRSAIRPLDARGRPRPPHEVLADLDRVLREADLDESPTAACCYALLDRETLRLQVANAGHPLPIRLRPGGAGAPIGDTGLLLGIVPEQYVTNEVQLSPGERVFLFTDGVGADLGDRFVAQLALHADLALEDQVGGALGAVVEFDDEGRPEDDVTVLALEVIPR